MVREEEEPVIGHLVFSNGSRRTYFGLTVDVLLKNRLEVGFSAVFV